MTDERLLKLLKDILEEKDKAYLCYLENGGKTDCHENDCIDALEILVGRNTPKAVKANFWCERVYDFHGNICDGLDMARFNCPCCGNEIACGELEYEDLVDVRYCEYCGQKLKWEEDEEQ